LFVAAGAFHVSRPADMIPELQGRFPIRVELNPLTREDFIQILKQPRNALTKQYQALLQGDGVELVFEDSALDEMATIAFEVNQQIENIGARRLHTIMSNVLDQILFDVPDVSNEKKFVITAEYVREKLKDVARSKDLSEFIL
jgi:ATP-dependent HslUV protease ATP-binding subunit HslU